MVDLDTQTKFILDRKRVELRENRLIEAQMLNQLEQDRELHNDGSRTTRSTLTQSSMNSKTSSWTHVSANFMPGRTSQYNSRRSSMLPSRISNIETILASRPLPSIYDDSEESSDSRSSDESDSHPRLRINSFTQE